MVVDGKLSLITFIPPKNFILIRILFLKKQPIYQNQIFTLSELQPSLFLSVVTWLFLFSQMV